MANRAVPVRPVRVRLLEDIKLLELAATGPCLITDEQGKLLWQSSSAGAFKVRSASGGIVVNGRLLARKSLHIKPSTFGRLQLGGRSYRGWLRLVKNPSGSSLLVINHVPLEQYVASVVGSELPGYFQPEAFKAQAVAARSYVLHRMLNTDRPDWDVSAGAASQVYSGLSSETAPALKAQRSTLGEVLVYGPHGREEIICAFYSSTCGGGTRAVWELKKGFPHIQPLGGVQIDLCQESPRYRWKKRIWSKAKLQAALAENNVQVRRLGLIRRVQMNTWAVQGRAKDIVLLSRQGRKITIPAEELRRALQLPSSWFRIVDQPDEVWFTNGRGWGHGMGMCQFGANRMAQLGYDYKKILTTYYPGSKLVRCY